MTEQEIQAIEKAADEHIIGNYFCPLSCRSSFIKGAVALSELRKPSETTLRPQIIDYMGKDASLNKAAKMYEQAPELYNYMVALDLYIDGFLDKIERKPSENLVEAANKYAAERWGEPSDDMTDQDCTYYDYCTEDYINGFKAANLAPFNQNAEKEMLEFAEWTSLENWTAFTDHSWKQQIGMYDFEAEPIYKTTAELYEQFKSK